MTDGRLNVAAIHQVFHGDGATGRLRQALVRARDAGADLALLPELPLDPWIPATRQPRDADAESRSGPRHDALAQGAREAGIGVLGGAIVLDRGERFNRALLFDGDGELIAHYDKLHVPCEEGFWESDHYGQGGALTPPSDHFGLRIGLQICSDMQRPQSVTALAAMGAEAILAPRATPRASHERWRTVLRAAAIAGACYVVSINRPRAGDAAAIGGPSLVVGPDGEVLVESEDPLTVVALDRRTVERARRDYPGYLDVRADLYATSWRSIRR
jgi:predicted amidohydrolase